VSQCGIRKKPRYEVWREKEVIKMPRTKATLARASVGRHEVDARRIQRKVIPVLAQVHQRRKIKELGQIVEFESGACPRLDLNRLDYASSPRYEVVPGVLQRRGYLDPVLEQANLDEKFAKRSSLDSLRQAIHRNLS
jgi:hypothetical protein